MTLQDWCSSGWLLGHETSAEEIRGMLAVADRDLRDAASENLSDDWRFNIAYNAALQLAGAALAAQRAPETAGRLTAPALRVMFWTDRASCAENPQSYHEAKWLKTAESPSASSRPLIARYLHKKQESSQAQTPSIREDAFAWARRGTASALR